MIERTFKDIPEGKINYADQQSFWVGLGWSRGNTWDELLQSKRILIISEAGAGKTYECRTQSQRLWTAGEPAFFVELAALATEDLRNLLDSDEEGRLDAWFISQAETATFFLDSLDELKLTVGSFERALKRLRKCIGGQLHRARVIITTRPIPFDEQLVRNLLPIPPAPSSKSDEEEFAKIAMGENREQPDSKSQNQSPDWRSVALMPLSDEQVIDFCQFQGVNDSEVLFEDLRCRNALEFARRPQDLIELCADWREHKRIRTHRDQVATNIRVKLLPRLDRPEPAELSVDKAIEGASRLALALQFMRRLTIRHSAGFDKLDEEVALDPAVILSDWKHNERKALLERPLFGFASYGRVRFHHRSVAEYLAAERLFALLKTGMPFRALKRLLFAETKGNTIVRPSKRAVAGWLALQVDGIFELLRDNEPAVLLNEGDPASLTQAQRNQSIQAFAERYGPGGWRGLEVPQIQVNRFASQELAPEIDKIWRRGVENPDVREILISLINAGKIKSCADILFDISQDDNATTLERIMAIDALVTLDDERLGKIASGIADADTLWPDKVSRGVVIRLFPKHMSVEQLCRTLRWIKREKWSAGDLSWQLPRLITASNLNLSEIETLRDGLIALMTEELKWQDKWPHITSQKAYLSGSLAATCERGLSISKDDRWLHGCVIALRLHQHEHYSDEPIKSLSKRINNLEAVDNSRLFWVEDAFLQSLRQVQDPWRRFTEVTIHNGVVKLNSERDFTWVGNELSDTKRDIGERALLLEAAIHLAPEGEKWREHVEGLMPLVEDESSLVQRVDNLLKPPSPNIGLHRWEKKRAQRKKQEERRKAKNRARWVQFWREVANKPEEVFSTEQSWNTAWDLWRVMSHGGDYSRSSGWNRKFIEEQFNQETADRLRSVLMTIWRNEHPTLPSERAESERNRYLVRWQLGLAAIYAEAENRDWANKLGHHEAQLAARFAQIELNGLPHWIEELCDTHPKALDLTLGSELSWELSQPIGEHGHAKVLHQVGYMSERVARLFLPRLASWLNVDGDCVIGTTNVNGVVERVRQVAKAILKYGDASEFENLRVKALKRLELKIPFELRLTWLSILMRIDPAEGMEKLANEIAVVVPSERSEAVIWLAHLFGDRSDALRLDDERFTPQLLLRLIRLAYYHVRIDDDAYHEGSYSPDIRDRAEWARSNIVTALFNTKGEEGLAAKLEMAEDPLCAHFNARILAVAKENWAHEMDAEVFDETQAIALDRRGEAAASTNEVMFAILRDRLSDLDELLLRDNSPREAWAGISEERVMRRVIARELRNAANLIYTVDQEAVTADEKETDIRLRSTVSMHEAVIELKLGDERTAKDLRDTIENQLVRKYMVAEYNKAGALLITISKDRQWRHPDESRRINVDELLTLLNAEAERVQQALGGGTYIHVHLLDLRPRLPTEANVK